MTDTAATETAVEQGPRPPTGGTAAPRRPGRRRPARPRRDAGITADPVADMRARAAAEQERIAAVRKVCGDDHAEIDAKAIKEGWDVTRTELEVLRAERPKAPAVHVAGQHRHRQRAGGRLHADRPAWPSVEKLLRREDRWTPPTSGSAAASACRNCCWRPPGPTATPAATSATAGRCCGSPSATTSRPGFSTIDIGGILSNVANKFLLEGFFTVERTWRNICAVRNVSDFKTVTSYRLIGTDQYEPVAPGGELKHGTLGNESYTNKADTYGLMLSIDRRDIINDDLGAITTVPRKLGRGSGLKINDVFWTIFLNNAAFFTAGNKNYLSRRRHRSGHRRPDQGRGSLHGPGGRRRQAHRHHAGDPAGAHGAVGHGHAALQEPGDPRHHRQHQVPRRQPAPGQVPRRGQPLPGQRQLHRLLAKAWYLLADPGDLPVIEVAFLNGQESPDHRDGRGGLQRARHPDAGLPRLRRAPAGSPRRRQEQGRGLTT